MSESVKQYVALFGGWLSAVLLFLGTINIKFEWFTQESIDSFVAVLIASVPFALLIYGVYKNSYKLSKKARKQEEELKRKGLK